jgi:hypothetical protein
LDFAENFDLTAHKSDDGHRHTVTGEWTLGSYESQDRLSQLIKSTASTYLDGVSPEVRIGLRGPLVWSPAIERSLREQISKLRSEKAQKAAVIAYLATAGFAERFRRLDFPVDDAFLLGEAIDVAEQALERHDRKFKRLHGSTIAEVDAAKGFAWQALIELEKKRNAGEHILNPRALLSDIVHGLVLREVDARMRTAAPGPRAHHRLTKKFEKELADEQMPRYERHELASKLAEQRCKELGGLLHRVADLTAIEQLPGRDDPFAIVFDAELTQMIDDILAAGSAVDPTGTRVHFTMTNRRAWLLFKLAGLHRKDIDWEKQRVTPHNGSEQLGALFRKLAAVITDWRL